MGHLEKWDSEADWCEQVSSHFCKEIIVCLQTDGFTEVHWLTDVSLPCAKGPLRLGPPSNQVSLGGGRLSEEGRPRPRGGSGADASPERLQHPQDRDRWHARVHGADWRPVPCAGCPQEKRHGVWEACEGVHFGSEITGRRQFCTQGTVSMSPPRPPNTLFCFSLSHSARINVAHVLVTKEANAITSYLRGPQMGVSSSTILTVITDVALSFRFIVVLSKSYLPHVIMLQREIYISVRQVCSIWMNRTNITESQRLAAMRVQVLELLT